MKKLLLFGLLFVLFVSCSKIPAGPAFEPYCQSPVYAKMEASYEHF